MTAEMELIAGLLLDIAAPRYDAEKTFTFTSGVVSPVYVDLRKLISFPRHRKLVMAVAQAVVGRAVGRDAIDAVAGGETAGISYAAWLSDELALPMLYVRKAAKGFGTKSRIEGAMPAGCRVLLVEDLTFDAGSKIAFAEAIRQEGGVIDHVVTVFDYGIPASRENLARHGLTLHPLCDWATLLRVGEAAGHFTPEQAAVVRQFLQSPTTWAAGR